MSLLGGVIAAVLTFSLVFLFRPVALKIQLVDAPNHRKHHEGDVPLVGGLAIFCGFLFSLLTLDIALSSWRPLLAACALMLIVGLMDDIRELNVRDRFLAQIGTLLLVIFWGDVYLADLGDLLGFGDIQLGWMAVPFTIFGAVGVMNAFNMIDGMDGLSSGVTLILLGVLINLRIVIKNTTIKKDNEQLNILQRNLL